MFTYNPRLGVCAYNPFDYKFAQNVRNQVHFRHCSNVSNVLFQPVEIWQFKHYMKMVRSLFSSFSAHSLSASIWQCSSKNLLGLGLGQYNIFRRRIPVAYYEFYCFQVPLSSCLWVPMAVCAVQYICCSVHNGAFTHRCEFQASLSIVYFLHSLCSSFFCQ